MRGLVEDGIDVAADQRLECFGIRPRHGAGLAHLAAPARDVVAGKARRRGDVVEHVVQAVIRRGAHQNAQLRFACRDVFEARQAGLGPHGEHEGVPGRDDGDGADRHRFLEDALPAQRHRKHGGGIDHRKIQFARHHRENAFSRAHAGKRRRFAAARMLQHHLGQNIVRHRVGGGGARPFPRRFPEPDASA